MVGPAIAILALLPLQAFAAKNVLDITCVDQAGKPLSGAKVQIQHIETQKWKDKKSDAKGVVRFDGLDDGSYRIVGRTDGYAPALYEYAMLKENAQESVTLKFEPGPTDKKLYFEDQTLYKQAIEAATEGIQSLQGQKYPEAENKLRVSLGLFPSNPDAWLNLAIAYLQQSKWEPAEEALKNASRISAALAELQRTRNPEASAALEQLHQRSSDLLQKVPALRLRPGASDDLAKKDFDAAIAKYQEIIKAFPDDSDTYYNLALALANAQRFEEAIQAIDKALQLRPNESDYTKLKQQIIDHHENFHLKQARAILEEADKLALAGSYPEALKKYEEARPLLSEKNQAVVFAAMGSVHTKMNQGDEAVADFKKAIELAPENSNYRKLLAQFYIGQKKLDEALKVYTEGRASNTTADQALVALAKEMSQQGNNEMADLAYEKALEANPQNAEACYELGMSFYFSKKNDARAKELLSKYLEIGKDPKNLESARNSLVVIQKRSAGK
jgi:tetratricopeptide (TPR) repeat protein